MPNENRSVMNNVYDFQSSEDFRLESKNKLILTYVGQKHSPIRPLLVLAFHAENIILTAQGKAIVLLDRRAIERENGGEKWRRKDWLAPLCALSSSPHISPNGSSKHCPFTD